MSGGENVTNINKSYSVNKILRKGEWQIREKVKEQLHLSESQQNGEDFDLWQWREKSMSREKTKNEETGGKAGDQWRKWQLSAWLAHGIHNGGRDDSEDEVRVKQESCLFYFAHSVKPENVGDRERHPQRYALERLIWLDCRGWQKSRVQGLLSFLDSCSNLSYINLPTRFPQWILYHLFQ